MREIPTLVTLLAQALQEAHASRWLRRSALFQRVGEFPMANDPGSLSDVRAALRSGPPVLQRYMPFWVATMLAA